MVLNGVTKEMKINRVKYLIVSLDEKKYLSNLIDYDGGKKYTTADFDINYEYAIRFTSIKFAKIAIGQLLKCKAPYFVTKKHNFFSKSVYKINSIPDVKIVKFSYKLEDIK